MLISRKSPLTGENNIRDIEITWFQYMKWIDGANIQDAMPHLSPDDREFLMTGITQEEWDYLFLKESI